MFSTNAFDYINVLDKAADASWKRENLITNNIANYDTPLYTRKDLDFQGVLKREMSQFKYTSLDKKVRDLNTHLGDLTVEPYEDAVNYAYRLDGNNVDVDSEQVELASEELRYQLITGAIKGDFTRIQAVLK